MAGMLAISPPPTSLKAIRARACAGSRRSAKRFKARSKSVSHFEGPSKPSKRLLKRLLKQKVAQGRFYGPDATPHDLGDNPIRSEFNYTLENGQRTKLEETFYFDHDDDGGQTTPGIAKTTTYDWGYDTNDRLLSETIDHHDDALDRTESFVMDLFGNRTNRTIDYVDPAATDQAFAYTYDANDRLISETLDNDNNGSVDQTTTYNWDGTQQSGKSVSDGTQVTNSQTFAYNLQGRLAEVITTPAAGPATKVTYSYDSSGIRVSSSQFTDTNTNGVFETSELDHTIEYLVDHRNHTGYAQTIAETTKDGNGDNVERTTVTFGTDEISQTTYTPDPAVVDAWLEDAVHFFGHDAHGSVRVLLDILGEIAQSFTYAAHGELLAIYGPTGTLVGTLGAADTAAALTSLLYAGEAFDSAIGQQYLRARWYNPTAGRFSRVDPYFGDLNNPLSFNKYNYVHSNPILGTDPTGLSGSFSLGGILGTAGIAGGLIGASVGAGVAIYAGQDPLTALGTIGTFAAVGALIAVNPLAALYVAGIIGTSTGIGYAFEESSQEITPIPADKKRMGLEYAELARAAYKTENQDSVPGWRFVRNLDNNDRYGYHGRVYQKGNTLAVAYAGTDDGPDIIVDMLQGIFGGTAQYDFAIEDAKKLIAENPNNEVVFTGHSLGGGLATAAAAVTGKRAFTFNAAGVHPHSVGRHGGSLSGVDSLVDAFRVKGEFLSTLQDAAFISGFVMPNSNGTRYNLASAGGKNLFDLHKMEFVKAGLQRAHAS